MTLAILPGLLCDSRLFGAQIAAFDAHVVDGFYGGASSIEAMADYALAHLPSRCALLGHSMGARVALEIWRREPGRIAALALADTGTHGPSHAEAEKRYAMRDLGRRSGAAALVDAWLPPMLGAAHRGDTALVAHLRDMAIDAGIDIFEAQIAALLDRPDVDAVIGTIDCPVMAIVGRDDEWSPVSQHEAIVARIVGARLFVVENAGHMAPAEEPDGFNRGIREWLQWSSTESLQTIPN